MSHPSVVCIDDGVTATTLLSSLHLRAASDVAAAGGGFGGVASALAAAQVDAMHKSLDIFLPTRAWNKIPLPLDQAVISECKVEHGSLPSLQVRLVHGVDARWAAELDQALLWLHDTIGQPYSLIGVHVESDHTSIRLLQLATGSRCVIIRIPDRATLLAQAAAAALEHTEIGTAATAAPALFTPLFFQLLSSRHIFKSGLDLCTDALQLHQLLETATLGSTHPRIELNSGLNIIWNMMPRATPTGLLAGAATSRVESMRLVEGLVESVVGVPAAFQADATQTYTDWGAERLTLRQVVHAAVNAQAAYVIACTHSLPTPFHLSDLPRAWLRHAAAWRTAQARQAEMAAAAALGMTTNEDQPLDDASTAHALARLSELYCARFAQGEEPPNPFVAALLQTDHPLLTPATHAGDHAAAVSQLAHALGEVAPGSLEGSGLDVDPANALWWLTPGVEPNTHAPSQEAIEAAAILDDSQSQALSRCDTSRISVIDGGVGVGKSCVIVAAVLSALDRSTSTGIDRAASTTQRVLIIAEAHAAVTLTRSLARFLPAQRLCCCLDDEAHQETDDLAALDYLHSLTDLSATHNSASFALDRDVLVLSPTSALLGGVASHLLSHRPTLVFEDAQQVWLLQAVLLLRRLPHTERIIITGDAAALTATVAQTQVESLLDAAICASTSPVSPNRSIAFHPSRTALTTQYRAPPHLATLISSLFYRGELNVDSRALTPSASVSRKKRAIGWVDVPATGACASPAGSWSNTHAEVDAITRLWSHYVSSGAFASRDVAIVPLHECARRELRAHGEFGRHVLSPEECGGAEFDVVFICLSAPGVTHHLADTRRALVAIGRARYKVYVLGDRESIAPYRSFWRAVEEYAETDVPEEIQRAESDARANVAHTPDLTMESVASSRSTSDDVTASEPDESSPSSSASSLIATAPTSVISPEDAPRIAHLYSLFLSYTPPPHVGPLLIDHIGKHFKSQFGSSWRNFEKLDRDAKLITFLAKYPSVFRIAQNAEESVHVNVEWVGSAEVIRVIEAAAPRGLLSTAAITEAPLDAVIDPLALESVLTLDPCIPPLDASLIDALFQSILSVPGGVLLSDLSKTFKQFHRVNWTIYTDLKLGEFLRKYSPAFFKFKNNRDNTRNPIVECVVNGLVNEAKAAKLAEPPKTVIASDMIESTVLMRRSTTNKSDVPAPVTLVKSSSCPASSSPSTDILTQASLLASSVPASQIDDFFRLECLRLVFLYNDNCGLPLTEVGNAFHALHGLRWKRLTKTELRVSDFMFEHEGHYFEFEQLDDAQGDTEDNANTIVYFVSEHIETPLYVVGAKGAPRRQVSGGAVTTTTATKKTQPTRAEKEKERYPRQKQPALSSDEFQIVGRRQQATVIPSASQEPLVLCGFCQTAIAPGECACPNCDSLVGDVPLVEEVSALHVTEKVGLTTPIVKPDEEPAVESDSEPQPQPAIITKTTTTSATSTAPAIAPTPTASPSPTDRDPYGPMSESDYLSASALESLSKKERRKLSWLCPGCKGCNELRVHKCDLCDFPKPKPEFLRFKNTTDVLHLPEKTKATNSAATAAQTKSLSSTGASTAAAVSPQYENEYVRIAHSAELGHHYVAKQAIPAGTLFLQDDVFWSSSAGALKSAAGSCIPNESQFSELMSHLLRDPVMAQLLARRHVSQYAMIGKLLNLKKPKDVGMKEWSAGVEMTLTGAQFHRETAPGHSKSCNCSYGRFWMKRQSALLVHSCWPNCAHVKRPGEARDSHSILATTDIAAGAVLTDCMHSAIINLPRDRRMQWINQTTGKSIGCRCDRCKTPRKVDAQLTATNPNSSQKVDATRLEDEYEAILKQYAKLNAMNRTVPDDPALSSPLLDQRYIEANYDFLGSVHTFLTCWHGLSDLHWRKQYLRSLFVTLVAKNELYDLDLMHPDERRMSTKSSACTAAATASSVADDGDVDDDVVTDACAPSTKCVVSGRWNSTLNPSARGYEEKRSRHHWFLQMILTNVFGHLAANAQFFATQEPLKCACVFLVYALIDWFAKEEQEHCVMTRPARDGGGEERVSCFQFVFERRRKNISAYLMERLREIEPNAEHMLKMGFPLRA